MSEIIEFFFFTITPWNISHYCFIFIATILTLSNFLLIFHLSCLYSYPNRLYFFYLILSSSFKFIFIVFLFTFTIFSFIFTKLTFSFSPFISPSSFMLFYDFLFLLISLLFTSILLTSFLKFYNLLLFSFFTFPNSTTSQLIFFSQPISQDLLRILAKEDSIETAMNFFCYYIRFF